MADAVLPRPESLYLQLVNKETGHTDEIAVAPAGRGKPNHTR